MLGLATIACGVREWELTPHRSSACILKRSVHAGRFPRIVVVGSVETARSLKRELALRDRARAAVVACISRLSRFGDVEMPVLGTIAELRLLIEAHDIDLLVVGGEALRVAVFDQCDLGFGPVRSRMRALRLLRGGFRPRSHRRDWLRF